jgi:hypothetical protein
MIRCYIYDKKLSQWTKKNLLSMYPHNIMPYNLNGAGKL